MEFYPEYIVDGNKAEKAVWQTVKSAFKDASDVAFHSYPLFEREIDILIVHRQLGLWVIECKGCYINNIKSINGAEWRMEGWYKDLTKPVIQARKQMFALKNKLSKDFIFASLLNFNFKVALPFINQEQWQNKGFYKIISTQDSVLITEDLIPNIFMNKLTERASGRQRNLTEEQWQLLMGLFGGTNQTTADKLLSPTSQNIPKKEQDKTDESLTPCPVSKIIKLPCNIQPDLKTSYQPESKLEKFLIQDEEDLLINDEGEIDEFLEDQPDEDDGYSYKSAKFHCWKQTRKKHYTEDSIRLYLQEIGRIRLLRADEEIELARKIADLLELERVREKLSQQLAREPKDSEWAEAVQIPLPQFRYRLHIARRAKDKLVASNLRLVVSIAKKYMNRGLSFQDLIQEGSLGLIRAAEKFDHEKGYKFSTYATWWIRQAITRAIADQSRAIRLPVHFYETISRIKKTMKLFSQEMGRKPTEEEIATRMEMTIEKLRFIAKSALLPISWETPIYVKLEKDYWFDQEDTQEYLYLGDLIEAKDETPEDQISKNLLREDLEKVLDSLSPRERDVIRLRYGLDDGRMKTLEEIGQIFKVTRERIRQIEAKALRKLRRRNRKSILKEYIRGDQPDNSQQKKYEDQSLTNQGYTQKTKNPTNYFQKAVVCHRLGDFLGAIENFTRALKLDPNNAQVYYSRGLANTEAEYHQRAIEDFTQAIYLNPQCIGAYYQRAHVRHSLGDCQKAIEDYSNILSLKPNEALAYFYRGCVCSTLEQTQAAIDNYNQALHIKPDFAEAYFHRGVALHKLGDLYRAIKDYNQALRIYPDFAEGYSRRGLAHYCLGIYQAALEDYSQALQLNSEDALTYYYRGLIYENLSDYVKALEDFNEVLEINPAFAQAYYNRGSVHYNLGNYQKALEDLDQILHINPNNAQAYNKRSSIRAALKDYQGAMADLQKAVQFRY